MLTLLFWNIGRRALADRVARIAAAHGVDVVLLAECASPVSVSRSLNRMAGGRVYFSASTASRVSIFTRVLTTAFRPLSETGYYSIRELEGIPGQRESLIVATAHLPSKREVDDRNQIPDAMAFGRAIAAAEDSLGHTRTLLVGDLNMNPFEFGVVAGSGLHGVMTRDVARAGVRVVRGREYRFFYNPMWRFFGDGTPGPAGTHFYRKADEECFFWNLFDQVLVRPALLDRFPADGVAILDSDGMDSLVKPNGRPDTDNGSDHLPVLVKLDV